MPDFTRYSLGARPSPPDGRDHIAQALSPAAIESLPQRFDLGPMPPVWDQGPEGSCIGHAMACILAFFALTLPSRLAPWGRTPSRRDAYEGARLVQPVPGSGAYARAACKWANQTGVCHDASWPYTAGAKGEPGPTAATERPFTRIASYARVDGNQESMCAALVNYAAPLFVMIAVTDGFYKPDAEGAVKYSGTERGYHAIAVIGYDQQRRAYRIRNSWGAKWGQGGYAWLPFSHPIVEAWAVTPNLTDENPPPPPAPPAPRPWWAVFLFWVR